MARTAEEDYDANAPFYDATRIDLTPFVDFYSTLLRPEVDRLVDIGCGTGTVTTELALRLRALRGGAVTDVTGVDLSAGMLARAQARDPSVRWLVGDMTALPDCGPVDLAVCCYNSLQHLDAGGLGRAFRSVRGTLAPEGRFAFDIYNPNFDYIRKRRVDTLTRVVTTPEGTVLEVREDSEFDEEAGILRLGWRVVKVGPAAREVVGETQYRLYQHRPETVEAALAAAGLAIVARHGDLDGRPWDRTALKQVIVCSPV